MARGWRRTRPPSWTRRRRPSRLATSVRAASSAKCWCVTRAPIARSAHRAQRLHHPPPVHRTHVELDLVEPPMPAHRRDRVDRAAMLGPVGAERLAQIMQALHQETLLETRAGRWAVLFRRRIPKNHGDPPCKRLKRLDASTIPRIVLQRGRLPAPFMTVPEVAVHEDHGMRPGKSMSSEPGRPRTFTRYLRPLA